MLLRLTVSNYKSFDAETEMPMVSSSKIRMMPDHVVYSNDVKLLKHAAVYGANASGKTNLIDCFRFMQQALGSGLSLRTTSLYCRNNPRNKERKSLFELQFSIGERFFAYGFTAVLSKRRVVEEWLYELSSKSQMRLLERRAGEGKPETDLNLSGVAGTRFDTYADDFAENETGLFLTELNRSKRFEKDSPLLVFKDVFKWITTQIMVIGPDQPVMMDRFRDYLFDDGAKRVLEQILGSFDTGVSGIELQKLSKDELADLVPRPVLESIADDIERRISEERVSSLGVSIRGRSSLVIISLQSNGDMSAMAVRLRHASSRSLFDFAEESDGTRRLFDLIILLLAIGDDSVFIIDELERSLHPMLVRQLLKLFMDLNSQHRAQLIFSTHEASIMSQELFRRDEIWFVDRGSRGDSRLYSLDRFKERFDKDISKAYLEGRYGAVPIFAELDLAD